MVKKCPHQLPCVWGGREGVAVPVCVGRGRCVENNRRQPQLSRHSPPFHPSAHCETKRTRLLPVKLFRLLRESFQMVWKSRS